MRLFTGRHPSARRRPASRASSLLTIWTLAPSLSQAITFTPAPPANLDLSQLGRIGLAGDFTGISLYQFEEQNEQPFSTNGSESLLSQLPNGVFASLVATDASINTMCTFLLSSGTMAGVIIGGNFTSLDGTPSQGIAMFNPNTTKITPLAGINGQVNAVLCDQERDTVYVGGNFKGANSTNAIAWYGTQGWTNLPFAGFNGPVTSITKASNGHIIFGGSFTGLGNASTPSTPDGQVINLSTATISSGGSSTAAGFSDPKNVVCKTSGADGAGNTWLLQDNTPGFWQANFNFGFQPTKIRLWNTHQDGRGTKTWRFTALPLNGILNLTYVDPVTGQNTSCTNQCPLSNDPKVPFQDFHFVNVIGMNSFKVDISEWFGRGGGLDGIELFENDIFSYAINDFNEPACANTGTPSRATATGPWKVSPSLQSSSQFLTAQLSGQVTQNSASIVFFPDIREPGNYSVNMYTPGCLQDNSCASRGQVNITAVMSTGAINAQFSTSLYQTNNFDKYDQIYFGYIAASTSGFRPSVTMSPLAGQSLTNMTLVAQRVGFTLINSTGGLNGLFDFDPAVQVINTTDFKNSAINTLGAGFSSGSAVLTMATSGDITYVGGNFSSTLATNIIGINSKDQTIQHLDGGLNGEVLSMQVNGTKVFAGGSFSNTQDNGVTGLNNVAVYDTGSNTWSPLGAGVDDKVLNVALIQINLTSNTPEICISFTGEFRHLNAFGNNKAIPVIGFGIWVPSRNNWLQNLNQTVPSYSGILTTSILNLPGGGSLYSGSISSSAVSANGAVTLSESSGTEILNTFPLKIQAPSTSQSGLTRRDLPADSNVTGVITGAFYEQDGRNVTILAGHFAATATNGSTINNLAFINGSNSDNVHGLGPGIDDNSTFVAVAVQGDILFAGGKVSGTVNGNRAAGLISYNLNSGTFGNQPPALSGANTTVAAIAVRPNTGDVYVGGSFSSAGPLGCPGVCFFSTVMSQWNRPGLNLDGNVHCMVWASDTTLVAGGNLTVNGTTKTSLVSYDPTSSTWSSFPGANALPGPVDVLTPASSDGKQLWASGQAANGSIYLMKYDGSAWQASPKTLLPGTVLRSLQMYTLTSGHDDTPLVASNQALMLTGSIIIPGFGSASAALFNGTTFEPFALTTNSGNTAGTISRIFTQSQNFFTSGGMYSLQIPYLSPC
jgi:Cortical protein marker for cell polarity